MGIVQPTDATWTIDRIFCILNVAVSLKLLVEVAVRVQFIWMDLYDYGYDDDDDIGRYI